MPKKTIYKYKNGDIIKGKYSDILIFDQIRIKYNNGKTTKGYIYKCLKCNNTEKITEVQIENKTGCNMCCPSSQKIIQGINDIATTDKWLIPYFKNVDDIYKYSHMSNKRILMICPHCGEEKLRCISKLYTEGLACSCGDKVSYANKFVTSLIRQLNIEFETEKVFEWSNPKRYDVYVSNNMIIENHGIQHYEESPRGLSLKEEQENDRYKKEIALENGIKEENYIIIDCRKSDSEFIKQNILNSNLNNIFNLSKIDWNKCHEFACNNLVKIACEHKNNNPELTTTDIGKLMGFSTGSIRRWLKKGSILKWCKYDSIDEMRKNAINNRILKSIISFDTGLIFESARDIEKNSIEIFGTKLDYRNISAVCLDKQKTHKGFTFKYTSDLTNEQIKEIQENAKLNQTI